MPVTQPPAPPSSTSPVAEKRGPEPGSLEDALLAELDQSRGGAPAPRSEPRADFGSRPTPPTTPTAAPQAAPSVEVPRAGPIAESGTEPDKDGSGTPEPVQADAPATPAPPLEETPADTDTSPETGPAEPQASQSDQPEKADNDASAPGKAADGSPVTMDAIEEEMARLLSEISGTRK